MSSARQKSRYRGAYSLKTIAVAMVLLAALLLPQTASGEVAAVLIDLPWRSQVDGQPDQRENAGLAGLGMVLAAYGQDWSTARLREEIDLMTGIAHVPADSLSLMALAGAHGLRATPLANARRLRTQLAAGRPALLFLGRGTNPDRARWVVAVGYTAENQLLYDDPAWPMPRFGQHRILAVDEEKTWQTAGTVGFWLERDPIITTPAPPTNAVAPATGDANPDWWLKIEAYADWFGVDPFFVAAVLLEESGGNPAAVGDQGHSVGLMQLHDQGVGSGLLDLRYDPLLNIWYGAQTLAEGIRLYGDPTLAYARYYNPGGDAAAARVMARYRALVALAGSTTPAQP
ncbi:MAG: transglycosylase SLT domain-containing protein [Chloroflexi bacterium]|nr:transglycosylase SLT domain-containing protein [Chloroflexota bacterium]